MENTGKRGDQDISRWQIKRKVDNEQEILYVFPQNTIIGSGKTIKIWSKGQGRFNPPGEFVHELEWRSGESMVTRLVSDSGEEKALYTQRAIELDKEWRELKLLIYLKQELQATLAVNLSFWIIVDFSRTFWNLLDYSGSFLNIIEPSRTFGTQIVSLGLPA